MAESVAGGDGSLRRHPDRIEVLIVRSVTPERLRILPLPDAGP
jgi:hypothetical protein